MSLLPRTRRLVIWAGLGAHLVLVGASTACDSMLAQNILFLIADAAMGAVFWVWGLSWATALRHRHREPSCYCGYPTAGNVKGTCPECGRSLAGQRPVPDVSRIKIVLPIVLAGWVHARAYVSATCVAYQAVTGGASFPPGGMAWPDEALVHRIWIAPLCVLAWAVYAIVIWCRSARRTS